MLSAAPVATTKSGATHSTRHRANHTGVSDLMYAAQQGDVYKVRKIIRDQPTSLYYKDRTGKSPLHYCCTSNNICAAQAADLMVMAAPDLVDSRDEDGFTPLHLAVIAGNMPLVTFLLANNADINAVDNEHHSVVHWATVCGETAALRAILAAGAPVSTPDVHGGYPLHYAAQMCGGDKENNLGLQVLQTLLGQKDIIVSVKDGDGRQPLLWAASAGSAKAMLALIRAGSSVESADKDGLTALHCAASRGHTDCIDTLLTLCGASPDVIDSNGCTALHYAVTLGHADATALLLAHGADPNRQDRKGRSPAHCGCAKGQFETLKLIGAHGANLWLRNARGDLPLHEAAASGRRDLVKWLLEMRPSQVNARNNDGRCPIHLAALNDNPDMCKILLDAGANVNPILRTSKNVFMTPLDCALQRGFRSTAKYLQLHGGVPASRLGEMGYKPSRSSAVSLQIRDDVTFWGDTSSDSERENGEKEKNKKKTIRRKLAYKYDKKKASLSGSDLENNKKNGHNVKSSKHKKKLDEKLREKKDQRTTTAESSDSTPHVRTSTKKNDKKSPSEKFDYSNEIIINGTTQVNINHKSEININSGVEEAIRQKSSTNLQAAKEKTAKEEAANKKSASKKEEKMKGAKTKKVSAKSQRSSAKAKKDLEKAESDKTSQKIQKETDTSVTTEIPETSKDKNKLEEENKDHPEVKDQSTNTSDETSYVETVIENKPAEVKIIQESQLAEPSDLNRSETLFDAQSLMSNTSEDVEEQKNLVVEASVHAPPKEHVIIATTESKTTSQLLPAQQIENVTSTTEEVINATEKDVLPITSSEALAKEKVIIQEDRKVENAGILKPTDRLQKQKSIRESPEDILQSESIDLQTANKLESQKQIDDSSTVTTAPESVKESTDEKGKETEPPAAHVKNEEIPEKEHTNGVVGGVDLQNEDEDSKAVNEEIKSELKKDESLDKAVEHPTDSQEAIATVATDNVQKTGVVVEEEKVIAKEVTEENTQQNDDASIYSGKTESQISQTEPGEEKEPAIKKEACTTQTENEQVAEKSTADIEKENKKKEESDIGDTGKAELVAKTLKDDETQKDAPGKEKEKEILSKTKKEASEGEAKVKKTGKESRKQFLKDKRKQKAKESLSNEHDSALDSKQKGDVKNDVKISQKRKARPPKEESSNVKEVSTQISKKSDQPEKPKSSEEEEPSNSTDQSESASSSSPKAHKSFRILDDEEAELLEKSKTRRQSRKTKSSLRKQRSRSEENDRSNGRPREKLRRSKIPTPLTKSQISKSDKQLYKTDREKQYDLEARVPSLPNIHKDSDSKALVSPTLYDDTDNERSGTDDEEERRISSSRRKKLKRRPRTQEARSAGSDYESSNLIDSGFEPSPRSSKIPKWRNMTERGVNMTSVTQGIQNNVRRYHLERKIFEQLLELKRLQIRAGQHNEAVLVKRAVDTYHQSCASTVGAGRYIPEDYTFKSFEQFLYHALRRLQKNGAEHLKGLPEAPSNPLLCTQSTHRCMHATHAYTGIPCAAYLPKMDHHTIPKIGFNNTTACRPGTGPNFLPNISSKKAVTLELCHGADKQVISLPTDRLDQNKRYYVTFTVKGQEPSTPPNEEERTSANAHQHAKSD